MQRRMLEPKCDEEGIHMDMVGDEGPEMACLVYSARDQAGCVSSQTICEVNAVWAGESEHY